MLPLIRIEHIYPVSTSKFLVSWSTKVTEHATALFSHHNLFKAYFIYFSMLANVSLMSSMCFSKYAIVQQKGHFTLVSHFSLVSLYIKVELKLTWTSEYLLPCIDRFFSNGFQVHSSSPNSPCHLPWLARPWVTFVAHNEPFSQF